MDRKRPESAASPPPPIGSARPGDAPRSPSPDNGKPGNFPPHPGTIERALGIVTFLRDHCEWDRRQTASSLVPHLLEEAHETADAIRLADASQIRDELGDLLLNVAFQIVVAEEAEQFSREDVIRSLEEKMVRRHPHVFGLGEPESWDAVKARERNARSRSAPPEPPETLGAERRQGGPSVLDSVPMHPDSLARAQALQLRASEVGFDWDDPSGALLKIREEMIEVAEAIERGSHAELHEEIGDLLFSVVNLARLARCHAPAAMTSAHRKFETRFRAVEALASARGHNMPGTSLEQLDALWDEVKRKERATDQGPEHVTEQVRDPGNAPGGKRPGEGRREPPGPESDGT
jgi:nucleoside triphosphate diphosphatase